MFVDYPDYFITTIFAVKEYDCRPQSTSPETMIIHANTESFKSQTYNDLTSLGIDSTKCEHTEADEFTIDGNQISDYAWATETAGVVTITIVD